MKMRFLLFFLTTTVVSKSFGQTQQFDSVEFKVLKWQIHTTSRIDEKLFPRYKETYSANISDSIELSTLNSLLEKMTPSSIKYPGEIRLIGFLMNKKSGAREKIIVYKTKRIFFKNTFYEHTPELLDLFLNKIPQAYRPESNAVY